MNNDYNLLNISTKSYKHSHSMPKEKKIVIDPAASAALQWHFGIVTEPPSDRIGKEYLAQHFPKRYQLEDDTLVG